MGNSHRQMAHLCIIWVHARNGTGNAGGKISSCVAQKLFDRRHHLLELPARSAPGSCDNVRQL